MREHVQELRKRVARNVKRLRKVRKWSREKLAEYAEVSDKQIYRLEHGQANVGLDILASVARSFGENVVVLFADGEVRRSKPRTLTKEQEAQFKESVQNLDRLLDALYRGKPAKSK